jgi:nucleotide-binding universal stress UspA family protein
MEDRVLSTLVGDQRRRAMSVLPEKILVATDGSEQAGRATRTAAELAGKLGAELHLIYVGEPPVVFHPEMRGYTALYERSEQDGRKLLEEEAERIRASGATVARSHLRMGRPDVQLLAVAGEIGAGMLVVGSRGLGGVKRALMAAYPTPWFITRTARCSSRGRKWSSVTLRCISPVRTDN